MHVMDNLSDQLVGNIYCMFDDEESAAKVTILCSDRFRPECVPFVNAVSG